ncbi:MAG: 2-isopropylmalate synthase [Alphaproteobacteria bacterium]|nr:2-isopropylmalate synthase [Alphaproteobacteria bacterium]
MAQSAETYPRRIAIFDTTLRDGEQAPGFSMSVEAKLSMAKALERLNVDVIEAGFAAASPGDAEAIARVAEEVRAPTICSLSRTIESDIEAAEKALTAARRRRLHIFLGTSPTHREAKLKLSTDGVLREIERSVSSAQGRFDEVEFSAEDAIRTERAFLKEALECAAEAGADILNVPDTVGYASPEEIYELFRDLIASVRRPEGVIFSAHCHDDLGMAAANSLAAIRAGANQIEGTINGIGERAGNCALEEVIMALKTRQDYFRADTAIATKELFAASKLLGELTGQTPPRNKAIVGRNAFAHEAGIHQHGVLEDRRTYEIMTPSDVGVPSNELVLGKHSGKHALKARAAALGIELGADRLESVFTAFKELADKQREVTDSDLCALISGQTPGEAGWRLNRVEIRASAEARMNPFARLTLQHSRRGRVCEIGVGAAPFEAIFNALCSATGVSAMLDNIDVASASGSCRAEVRVAADGRVFVGAGEDPDVIIAASEALVAAFNHIEFARGASALAGAA